MAFKWLTPYHEMSEGRVYALGELLRSDNPAHAAYLKAVMVPSGTNAARMMRVIEPSGVNAWLTITRRTPDFKLKDDTLLTSIAPYLRSVLRSFVALERERTNAVLAGDAIQRLRFGWITFGPASLQHAIGHSNPGLENCMFTRSAARRELQDSA
ncbi:MAG: hypothetical protein JWO52_6500 [Gammaproteobacteria bacterium]|jgi:hypothetical protein|nr:hypothetical protein [Gammaproteobacteria bacterium]